MKPETEQRLLRRLRRARFRRVLGDWLMIGLVLAIIGGIIWAALTQ